MSQNPFEAVSRSWEFLARGVQTHVSRLFPVQANDKQVSEKNIPPFPSVSFTAAAERGEIYVSHPKEAHSKPVSSLEGKSSGPETKEDLGRATWTLLHMIAAQYPDHPSRQQKRDVKELMAIIARLYPCQECSDHFKEILRENPVLAGSQEEFSQWLCHVHNTVNRSLGKLIFPCRRVNARWTKLDCENRGCDVEGTSGSSA